MNEQNQLIQEISKTYNAVNQCVSRLEASDVTTEVHQHIMRFRELMLQLAKENETLRALKNIIACTESISVEKALLLINTLPKNAQIHVLDQDASRDDMLALSKIDKVTVVKTNLDINSAVETIMVLLHKSMTVDWLPKS